MHTTLSAWDRGLFRAVADRDWPVGEGLLPRLSRSADHGRLWLGTAAGIALSGLGGPRARRGALYGVASLAVASLTVNTLAKWSVGRQRPVVDVVPTMRRLKRQPVSPSFPSGHAASAAAFATGLALESRGWGAVLLPVAALVGFSRVYTGAHYPSDVLAGAALGVGAAVVVRAALTSRLPSPPGQPPVVAPALPGGRGLQVVANPAAGTATVVREARRLLPRAEFTIWDEDAGPLAKTLRECARRAAAEGGALAVLGGDGTVNAAAPVALEAGVPLAVLPGGTRNHLALDLDIATLQDACRAVERGEAIAVEVARFTPGPVGAVSPGGSSTPGDGERTGAARGSGHFVNTFSLGSYPDLVRVRERWAGRIGPWAAGMVAAVVTLRTTRPVEVTVGGRRRAVWLLFAGNCAYRRLGTTQARRPSLVDGLLDLHVVRGGRWARTRLLLAAVTGLLHRSPVHAAARVSRLRISGIPPGTLCAFDGEIAEAPAELTLDKEERPLTVYRPLPGWLRLDRLAS